MLVNVDNQTKAGKVGVIEVMVGLVKCHIDQPDLLTSTCKVLCNILDKNKNNQTKAGKVGVVEAKLPKLLKCACLVLQHTMRPNANRCKLEEAGVEAMSCVILKHRGKPAQYASEVLRQFALRT